MTVTMARIAMHENWLAAWAVLGCTAPAGLLGRLLGCYAEPQRHYHTQQHLGECLAWFERHKEAAERPGEVALALWFHDAIYDVHAHDNEARSADWARDALREAGVADDVAHRVHALVMATRHDAVPVDPDARFLIDIDLSILGAGAARFAAYEQQIRSEYAHVPADQFATRRRGVLQQFMSRAPLFHTAAMQACCESQARVNLRCAIEAVS